jgi:hypothetical protein
MIFRAVPWLELHSGLTLNFRLEINFIDKIVLNYSQETGRCNFDIGAIQDEDLLD